MPTYTYVLTNNSTITVVTAATQSVITNVGEVGYAVTSISGTWAGATITGMNGAGGAFNGTYDTDNAIFPTNGTGDSGTSYQGIDDLGLLFNTATKTIQLYCDSASGPLSQTTFPLNNSLNPQSSGYVYTSSYTVACFATGTRIETTRGQVAVEDLTTEDVAITAGGAARAIKWLGHVEIACDRHARPHDVWPIRIEAGAFGQASPRSQLFLSPDHAVLIDGVLIPARYLVNGRTIMQVPRAKIGYWHVELDRHDVILADGLACESYLDTGNRGAFDNGGAPLQLHPDLALRIWEVESCAPLVTHGPHLEAARSWLQHRARELGHRITLDPGLTITANGSSLTARIEGSRHSVALPPGTRRVTLHSRSAVPAELSDFATDHRRLGIAISAMSLDGERLDVTDPRLCRGWQKAEPSIRWTDGRAEIEPGNATLLEFDLAMTAQYWLEDDAPAGQRRAG